MSVPNVCGPPCSTVEAITGMSTEYGIVTVLTTASRVSAVRTGAKPTT